MGLAHWIILFAGFELIGFLIFGWSIATAIPEEETAGRSFARSPPKLVLNAR
jgi:hypothetical protein